MVTTVNELVQEIKDAQDSFPADLTNLLAAVAPTFNTSTAYSAGAYVWQGGKLYRFTAAHPAGTWTGTDAVAMALGNDVADLKSAINRNDNDTYTFEIFDTTWESGGLNPNTGKNSTNETRIRTPSYIPVLSGRKLRVKGSLKFKIFYYSTASNTGFYACDLEWVTEPRMIENTGAETYYIKIIAGYTDDRTISDIPAAAEEINIERAIITFWKDNGLLADLGITSLLSCTTCGYYRSGAAYTESITDLPADFENDGIELYVTNPAFENDNFCTQTLESLNGVKWNRVISCVNDTWSVYRDWVKSLNTENGVTIEKFGSDVFASVKIKITNVKNFFWNVTDESNPGKAVKTALAGNFYASVPLPVSGGETYTITGRQGRTDKTRIWIVTDDDYNIIAMAENYNGVEDHTVTFTIPEGGTVLLMSKFNPASVQTLYQSMSAFDMQSNKLKGLQLSLLGDSISAYAGTIPSGNDAYYNGTRADVTSPDQMWWKILCDKTGMIPLVINGWSGSGVNWQTDSDHTSKVPMSDDSRAKGLHDGTTTPDVVLIAGGVNDYSYAESAQNEPLNWDGKTVPGYTEPSTGKIVYNSFTEAYAATVMKIQERYPSAIVVALSTWFTMRGTDTGCTYTHTVGQNVYTQQDYNDKIRFVAETLHIPYIDVSNIGFNRYNFYPTYASDSATIPTHPNAAGQAVMGKAIAEKLIALVGGYLT
jgi:lysophospholipase L1-like esterase